MRTAAGEEEILCWGGCYKFFPSDTDGRHTYTMCPFIRVDRVREHALPCLKRFRHQNGPLNRKIFFLLVDPNRLTAAFCQPPVGEGGINKERYWKTFKTIGKTGDLPVRKSLDQFV